MKHNRHIKQRRSDTIVGIINMALLIIMMVFFIYPFYNCVIMSFNDGEDAVRAGLFWIPRIFTMENYQKAVSADGFIQAAIRSVLRTVIGTFLSIVVTSMYAYSISKPHLRMRKFYVLFGVITMFFSGGMIPTFLNIKNLGLYNRFSVYILPGMFSMFYAIIFMNSFREIPSALEESAMLDGANQLQIFFKIILQVSKPTIAAIAIFTAVGHWNSWTDTMLYTDKKSINTLSYLFAKGVLAMQYSENIADSMAGEAAVVAAGAARGTTSKSVLVATMVLSTAPIMVIYPFFQRYFVKGVMIGSIK